MDDMYLTCRELVELVTDYLEGAMTPDLQARFEEHIMTCAPCQAHLDQMKQTIEVVGRIPEESVAPAAEHDLVEAFRDWKKAN
jgi:predicted anti-sigma-YlaC factor YlaD